MVLDLSPPLLQFRERDRCRLVCVDQALHLAPQHVKLPRNARAFALTGAVGSGGITAALLETRAQQGRLGQQLSGPLPDLGFDVRRRDAAAVTSTAGVAWVAGRANISPLIATVCGADHPSATPTADQERAQQIRVPSVVPPRALPVVPQLLLSQVPGSMIAGTETGIHSSAGRSAWL